MGIRDKIDKGNINETYYSGFFAILSISQYNQTTGEIDLVKDNIELVDIINKKEDNELLNDIQKSFLSRNQLSKKRRNRRRRRNT
jgi:dimeric dUTPase (all-alpha-NTP-PPase superfamily)